MSSPAVWPSWPHEKASDVTAFFRHRHRIGQDNKRPSAAPGVKSDRRLGQFSSRCQIGRCGVVITVHSPLPAKAAEAARDS